MRVLLDTHAAIWLLQGDARLGAGVLRVIRDARPGEVHVSDMVLLETSMLLERGRIMVAGSKEPFLRRVAASFIVLPIGPEVAASATDLSLAHVDPFDRVMVATAMHHAMPLATRDAAITDSELVSVIWGDRQ